MRNKTNFYGLITFVVCAVLIGIGAIFNGNSSVGGNVSGDSGYVDSSYYDTIPAPGQRQVAVEKEKNDTVIYDKDGKPDFVATFKARNPNWKRDSIIQAERREAEYQRALTIQLMRERNRPTYDELQDEVNSAQYELEQANDKIEELETRISELENEDR